MYYYVAEAGQGRGRRFECETGSLENSWEEVVVVCGVSRVLDCNDVGLTPHIIRLYCVTL